MHLSVGFVINSINSIKPYVQVDAFAEIEIMVDAVANHVIEVDAIYAYGDKNVAD